MDQRPKCKRKKLIQLPKETIRKKHDIGFGNGFLDMTPKAQAITTKIDKVDLVQTKNFCTSKEHYQESEKTTHRIGEHFCKSYI